jgi:hypothetical protein
MFEVFHHQGNANQNYTEIASHPNQNGYHQENKKEQMLGKRHSKRKLQAMFVRM